MATNDERVLGKCSNCGGEVVVPTSYMSTQQPVPTCNRCGATAKTQGPVIPMNAPRKTGY